MLSNHRHLKTRKLKLAELFELDELDFSKFVRVYDGFQLLATNFVERSEDCSLRSLFTLECFRDCQWAYLLTSDPLTKLSSKSCVRCNRVIALISFTEEQLIETSSTESHPVFVDSIRSLSSNLFHDYSITIENESRHPV